MKTHYPSQSYYSYKERPLNFLGKLRRYLVRHTYEKTFIGTLFGLIKKIPALPKKMRNGTLLDVGCGSGDTILLLKQLGWDVYGLEIDMYAVKSAKKKGLSNVQSGGYLKMDTYKKNFFDAVRMYHVIEHLDNPKKALQMIHTILKKNGECIIGTVSSQSIVARIFGQYWYNLDIPRHSYVFSADALLTLMKETGFRIKRVEYCSGGGIAGSIQYMLTNVFHIKVNLVDNPFVVLLFYPIEWICDVIHKGDVFVIHAEKI